MVLGHRILRERLLPFLADLKCDRILMLVDEVVYRLHRDALSILNPLVAEERILPIASGEDNKTLDSTVSLWRWLLASGATRHSVLVLVGGGALTDLGGFVAATYMRGIRIINLPTTLLGMVDASVGGKTAIDFSGVKNIIGAFHQPIEVFIDTQFLDTLPLDELYSGYAEIIKTALLEGEDFWTDILRYDDLQAFDTEIWLRLIERAITYKEHIVEADFKELGLRKVLNLGHTVGHALEAMSHTSQSHRTLLHGEAVAIGLLVESYISMLRLGLDRTTLRQLHTLVRELYRPFVYTCRDYPKLLELMRYDKKNTASDIRMIGLVHPGETKEIIVNDEEEIKEALDFYRETLGS